MPLNNEEKMRHKKEINALISASYKDVESALDMKIRNGQAMEGVRKALLWVLQRTETKGH
jgi:hypothetical protein